MDATDFKLSRKMEKLCRRFEQLVQKEMGEEMGVAVVVFPWTRPGEGSRIAEYQYASNAPRPLMRSVFEGIIGKWRAGAPDLPPHVKQ